MWVHVLWFVLGLTVLVVGAESLVRGASRLAGSVGVSPLVIGLTVVAFGTSTPEMAVSVHASLAGSPDIAIGNVVGSNIANILLILGISALIIPLLVSEQVIRQEVPVMIAATVLLLVLALDGNISRIDAGVLFVLVIVYTVFLILQSRRSSRAAAAAANGVELPEQSQWDRHWGVQLLLIVVGLAALVLGSRWLVESAVVFARFLGISDLVVGLTIVAVGTSLPEIATSALAALRGERDIAVGNVIGSNLFNILAVLGVTGLVSTHGIPVAEAARNFDLWVMLAVAVACLPIMLTGREIARWEGAVFLGYYAAYTAYLVLAAQHHSALPAYSLVMLGFVLPITVLTIAVSVVNHGHRGNPRGRPGA